MKLANKPLLGDKLFNCQKIHLLGAPGSGATTLGKAIAQRLGLPHFDADDFHWFTSDPLPYKRKRNPEHRRKLLAETLKPLETWVLSGSVCGWGDFLVPDFQWVIYCSLAPGERLARIQKRETERYGSERISPGGDLNPVFEKFLNWAADYDLPTGRPRSRDFELDWLEKLHCPVLKIETEGDLVELLDFVLESVPADSFLINLPRI